MPATETEQRLPANKRNPKTHRAILDATLDLLDVVRYANLTIEAITTKAGVSKATVYRWWPSKGALVAEAISRSMRVEDPPETDDFRADLITAVEISIANFARSRGGALMTALAADLIDDPALLTSFREDFVEPRRRVMGRLIDRGVREGYFAAESDAELLMDVWAGVVFYRALMKHRPIDDDLAAHLVDLVLGTPRPARRPPPRRRPAPKQKPSPRAAR